MTPSTQSPSCQFLVKMHGNGQSGFTKTANCCAKFATRIPMKTIEIGPGHQATNPAKNPQKGPRTLWVHTYSEPSSGNIRPSCAVTNAPVIRKVANPTIQKMNTDGPANCRPAALLMNRTTATKMTTRSNGPSVLATRAGAIRSESISSPTPGATLDPSAAIVYLPVHGAAPNRDRQGAALVLTAMFEGM